MSAPMFKIIAGTLNAIIVDTDLISENSTIDTTEYIPDIDARDAKALLWTKRFSDKSYLLASLMEEEFVKADRPAEG